MKKCIILATAIAFFCLPAISFAVMGEMTPKSKDIEINFFGSLKTYPTFSSKLNFNSDTNVGDWMLDESGAMDNHTIRNELRIGWLGKGKNWDFLIILESDFNLDKVNGDRGQDATTAAMFDDSGMSGEDFGVEKLNVTYNFGPFAVETGWNTKFLDIMTGGLLYGDDHPYLGLTGKLGSNFSWEALYLVIQDQIDTGGVAGGPWDTDALDWRVYTLKGIYKTSGGFVISPFYAYSDNDDDNTQDARVHYFGAEAYGKVGMFVPRLEFVYATGETDKNENPAGIGYDISAWAAYGSLDFNISPAFIPYIGATFMSGDSDDDDSDIDAFNGITDIARYTPTFGIENAFIYRLIPMLGSHLYSHTFDRLASTNPATKTPGYGWISNSGSGSAPGLIQYGIGAKGNIDKWFYKTQVLYFLFEDEGGLEDIYGRNIDDEVGLEWDLRVGYNFSKHFTLADTFSVFDPGDAIQDIYGNNFDDTAILNTVELIWNW